jgi:hypothetical protein
MTTVRYHAYCRVRDALGRLSGDALDEAERDLLRDLAEGLLLARADDEVEELRGRAAVALSLLVGMRRWTDTAADEMWERLVACGPRPPTAATARPTVLA